MKYFLILTLIITGLFSVQVEKVEAVSWQNNLTTCGASGCTTVPYYNVTVNTDKLTYDPGENISLSSFMQALYCSNSAVIYSLSASISGDFDTLANASIVNGGDIHYATGNLTAPTAPGVYSVDLTSCHFAWGLECTTANILIEVSGTNPVPPTPTPTATISGSACRIPDGGNTCLGTLDWFITNASNPNIYNNNGTTYSSVASGNNMPITLNYGLNTIYARDGVSPIANTVLFTQCENGLVWSNGLCVTSSPVPNILQPPIITVSLSKELIRSGQTTDVSIIVTAPYSASCTLYGATNQPIVFMHQGNINSTHEYLYTTRPLNSAQIITVACEPSPAISILAPVSAEARVNVIPTVQET